MTKKKTSHAWISNHLKGIGNSKCKFIFKLNSAYVTSVLICNLWEHALFIISPKIREQSHTLYLKQSGSYLYFLTTELI